MSLLLQPDRRFELLELQQYLKNFIKKNFENNTDTSTFYAMSKMINEETFSRDKSPEHEDKLPPSMVEVKNAWKCISNSARAFIK
jgi:uncharacterized protein (DUF736 family)